MLNDILFVPINKIKKLIGVTTDTGGSSTAGTVMGKLNNIINNNVSSTIGETTDTGGTATAGTVMGKLNGLFDQISQTNDKMVTDNDMIKACMNFMSITASNLPVAEKEILNISGEGFVSKLSTYSSLDKTTTIKVYIDGELFFHFGLLGRSGVIGKTILFGYACISGSSALTVFKLDDIHRFINGDTTDYGAINNIHYNYMSELLCFQQSLRVVACSTIANTSNYVSINYGLMG